MEEVHGVEEVAGRSDDDDDAVAAVVVAPFAAFAPAVGVGAALVAVGARENSVASHIDEEPLAVATAYVHVPDDVPVDAHVPVEGIPAAVATADVLAVVVAAVVAAAAAGGAAAVGGADGGVTAGERQSCAATRVEDGEPLAEAVVIQGPADEGAGHEDIGECVSAHMRAYDEEKMEGAPAAVILVVAAAAAEFASACALHFPFPLALTPSSQQSLSLLPPSRPRLALPTFLPPAPPMPLLLPPQY